METRQVKRQPPGQASAPSTQEGNRRQQTTNNSALLTGGKKNGLGTTPENMASLAHLIGNHALQRLLAQPALDDPTQPEEMQVIENASALQRAPELENRTGLPDDLKAGIEHLSGFSLDDVHVHVNSDKPGRMDASAYAQGTEIHVAPGKEQYLPHEAWHVVQQKQGRVEPSEYLNGTAINAAAALEHEADRMGEEARHYNDSATSAEISLAKGTLPAIPVLQPFRNVAEVRETNNYKTAVAFVNGKNVPGKEALLNHLQTETGIAALWGFIRQVEVAQALERNGAEIHQFEFRGSSDYGVYVEIDIITETDEGFAISEVKNWTGFANWPEKDKKDAETSLQNQLKNYINLASVPDAVTPAINLFWKGGIPERIARVIEAIRRYANEKGIQFAVQSY